jgi:hypothetical protein
MTRTSHRESHFKIWKGRVEKHVQTILNMNISLDDLPDEDYRVWFDQTNTSPKDVAKYISYHSLTCFERL